MIEAATVPPYRYALYGLTVASDVPLPVRSAVAGSVLLPSESTADVTMRVGEVPGRLAQATHRGPCWAADATRFLLDLPDIGRFLAEAGRAVTIQPAPGVAVEDILIFATGTAMAAILYQRGALLLHASAVGLGGRSFAFCGPSGAGKSTLVAALCRAGCDFISDDVCAIDQPDGGAPVIHPDGRVLRLYPDSIGHMGLDAAIGSRVRQELEKFHVSPPAHSPDTTPLPVAAIYILADSNSADPPGIARLGPLEAAQALLRQSYRRRMALAYADRGQPAARTAALLSRVGVYRLHRPRDFAQLDETVARLRAHWDGLA